MRPLQGQDPWRGQGTISGYLETPTGTGPLTGTISGYHETPTGTGPLTGTISEYHETPTGTGPLTGTISEYHETPTGTGPLTGTISGYETRMEHEKFLIFEYLEISILPSEPTDNGSNLSEYIIPENVMEACRAVTRCWSLLKSSFSCKNLNLTPLHSSWRGAKVLYSMIYIFRLLVSKNRGGQLDDTLLLEFLYR